MLFQRALSRANGPIDAEHIAYVIMLATGDDDIDAQQEQAEQDFLLLLLMDEIRRKKPQVRSFENILELLRQDDCGAVEFILKISQFWTDASYQQFRQPALNGIKTRLLQVLRADDPDFV
jgi:hypothetical protein